MDNVKVYRFPYLYPYKLHRLCYDGWILENLRKSILARIHIPFLFLMELAYMRKIIKKEKIDIVHAHWILPQGFIGARLKKLFKIKLIVTIHGSDLFALNTNFYRRFQRFTYRNADSITVNSRFTKTELHNRILEKEVQ